MTQEMTQATVDGSVPMPENWRNQGFDSLQENKAPLKYSYSHLSKPQNIRLLRLMPYANENAAIQCRLFEYPLQRPDERVHQYEALSYVWGSEQNEKPIYIQSGDGSNRYFLVRPNLYAALLRLRDRYTERMIWIDAICIDQENKDEKAQQIQFMAQIYARAIHVIVWLGDAVPNSDQALQEILDIASEQHANPVFNSQAVPALPIEAPKNQQAILALLDRPWFQRIWVLQEVAAARHVLIKCGSMEMDGYAFCLGLGTLNPHNSTPELQGVIRSVAYLIMSAAFRPRYGTSEAGRLSLDVRPLGELVDMYHTRKATEPLDKVYALFGMSSDSPSVSGLPINYETPWKIVFRKLINFCLSDKVSVSTWNGKEVAIVRGKGCVLGHISSVEVHSSRTDRQRVGITWNYTPSHSSKEDEKSSHFIFQASAKPIQVGDVVCRLRGASKPTIVRPYHDYSAIIMISIPIPDALQAPGLERSGSPEFVTEFTNHFLLVWDWEAAIGKFQGNENFNCFVERRELPNRHKSESPLQKHLNEATRLWNTGLLLQSTKKNDQAESSLRKAFESLLMAISIVDALESADLGHSRQRKANARRLSQTLGLFMEGQGGYALSSAAASGYQTIVELLLDKGADLEAKDSNGHTVLYRALERNDEAMVTMWADRGADLETTDNYGDTPLLKAVKGGHLDMVQVLLDKGADVKAKDKDGFTPLHRAYLADRRVIAKLLLDRGAEPQIHDSYGWTPLWIAASTGDEATVKLLLDNGADPEAKNNWGSTPLTIAAECGHMATVKLLLDKGAHLEAKNTHGSTPLTLAAEKGREAVVKLLLEKGANLEAKTNHGSTPLIFASEAGHEAVVKLLLDKGADPEAKIPQGSTPLIFAAKNGRESTAKLLLDNGANLEAKTSYNSTPLIFASEFGHEAVVKLLLDKGADPEVKTIEGCPPLIFAAQNGHEATAKLLLDKGVDPEAKTREGVTPLIFASARGHAATVKLLLDKGADLEGKNNHAYTALVRAAENGHEGIVKLLLNNGANLEAKTIYGSTALLLAAESGREGTVKLLLDEGADLEVKNGFSSTPLHLATAGGHEAVVKLLLEKGANARARTKNGYTSLFAAVFQWHEAIIKLLLDHGVDPEIESEAGYMPLWGNTASGDEAILELLRERGAKLKANASNSTTK